jgi:hypothetical protein
MTQAKKTLQAPSRVIAYSPVGHHYQDVPLVLNQEEVEYKLKFNCKPCEMEIWEKDAEFEVGEE